MRHTHTQLADHINGLASAFRVRLLAAPSLLEASAVTASTIAKKYCVADRRLITDGGRYDSAVRVVPVEDGPTCHVQYAVSLHELGHCLSPIGSIAIEDGACEASERFQRLSVDSEYAAWEWAHHQALSWCKCMEIVRAWALRTHVDEGFTVSLDWLHELPYCRHRASRRTETLRSFARRITT